MVWPMEHACRQLAYSGCSTVKQRTGKSRAEHRAAGWRQRRTQSRRKARDCHHGSRRSQHGSHSKHRRAPLVRPPAPPRRWPAAGPAASYLHTQRSVPNLVLSLARNRGQRQSGVMFPGGRANRSCCAAVAAASALARASAAAAAISRRRAASAGAGRPPGRELTCTAVLLPRPPSGSRLHITADGTTQHRQHSSAIPRSRVQHAHTHAGASGRGKKQ